MSKDLPTVLGILTDDQIELLRRLPKDDYQHILTALERERECAEANAERDRVKRENAERVMNIGRITNLLFAAENALREAGELGSKHNIAFNFVGPKGSSAYHQGNWMESACYASDGWYDDEYFDGHSVDGKDIQQTDTKWESSDCLF